MNLLIKIFAGFYPVFFFRDDITGDTWVLDGEYSMVIVAGGRKLEDMVTFNGSAGIVGTYVCMYVCQEDEGGSYYPCELIEPLAG